MGAPRVTGIVQIGILVSCVDEAIAQYAKLLGIDDWNLNFVDTANGSGRDFRIGDQEVAVKAKIAWTTIGGIELELIEPQDETSVYARFLETHGPGIHHLMIETNDDDRAISSLRDRGLERMLSGELQSTRFEMFDLRSQLGLISEFASGDALVPDETRKIRDEDSTGT